MTVSPTTRPSWLTALVRRHPAAALPRGAALSEPPESLDPDTAKAALEQVSKRLDAELAIKSSTETRALALAGQCTTLLSGITAALLVEFFGKNRLPLVVAGIVAVICLLAAVLFAYSSAKPQKQGFLPGRLPDEIWDDLIAPNMKAPEFMARLMMGLQDAMMQNETNQYNRARSLANAVLMVKVAVPLAIAAALITGALGDRLASSSTTSTASGPQNVTAPAPVVASPASSPTPPPPNQTQTLPR